MGKSTSFRPPYGLQGCSGITRNNYDRQCLFTFCKCHSGPVALITVINIVKPVNRSLVLTVNRKAKMNNCFSPIHKLS